MGNSCWGRRSTRTRPDRRPSSGCCGCWWRSLAAGWPSCAAASGSWCGSPADRSRRRRRRCRSVLVVEGWPDDRVDGLGNVAGSVALYQPSAFLHPPPCRTIVPLKPHCGANVPGVVCASLIGSRRIFAAVDLVVGEEAGQRVGGGGEAAASDAAAELRRGCRLRHHRAVRLQRLLAPRQGGRG